MASPGSAGDAPADPPPDAGQRYLPLRPDEALELCLSDLPADDRPGLRQVSDLLGALVHASYRERWQRAKDAYAPFSPDVEARAQRADAGSPDGPEAEEHLVAELRSVLDAANYDEVPRSVLDDALGESSVFQVRLDADLDDFADLLLFRRGLTHRHERQERWWGLRSQELDYLEYRRVVLYARYRDRQWFADRGRDVDALPFLPGKAVLKLFQEVPEKDLEMLLPNTEVRMRTIDKVVIGVPALASGIVVAVTKLATALGLLLLFLGAAVGLRSRSPELDTGTLVTLLGGFVAVGAYLWRQYGKFTSRRTSFMKTLSENLYYKTVGAGPGVLFTVLDAAEEEDVKEALLAYRCLLDGPLAQEVLDERVEERLRTSGRLDGQRVDFEVADAVGKLERLGVVRQQDGRCVALGLDDAVTALRTRWRELGDALAPAAAPD